MEPENEATGKDEPGAFDGFYSVISKRMRNKKKKMDKIK